MCLQTPEPGHQRFVQSIPEAVWVRVDRVSRPRLVGRHTHSARSLFKAPLVDAQDALHGPGPESAGMVLDEVDRRRDSDIPARPSEAVAWLELSLDLRGGDLSVPR